MHAGETGLESRTGSGLAGVLSMSGPLIGREAELGALGGLLADPAVAMVTLTGPSGVGKTRLALAALAAVGPVPTLPRVVVSLSAVRSAALMVDAVADAVLPGGSATPRVADALWQCFGGDPVYLLLDNLEQIPGAGDVVAALLAQYPAVTVLATSLREVGVPGERVVRVAPLALPSGSGVREPADDPGTAPAPLASAVALFVERVLARDATGRLSPEDLAAASEVCRAVGGLPLAIELAAARAASVPVSLMAAQLGRSGALPLLQRDVAGVAERHRSLGASLAWTTDLLPPPAAHLLAALSTFEGPTTFDGVVGVAPEGESSLDALASLVDLHLVEVDGTDPQEPLFSLLRPVRAFAAERLAASGNREDSVRRHATWVGSRLRSGRPLRSHELEDALVALDRARLEGTSDAVLDLTLHAALATTTPGAQSSLVARVESLLDRPVPGDPLLEARALVWSTTRRGSDAPDREAFAAWTHDRVERTIRAARASGDPSALLDALELTVRTVGVTLDRSGALAGIEEGLRIAQRAGDPARLARFRMWSGMVTLSAGHHGAAEQLLLAAFASGVASGDRVATDYAALYLRSLGVVESGLPGVDLPDLTDLLDSAWRHHDQFAAMVVLSKLVARALDAADLTSAARYAGQILPVAAQRMDAEPVVPPTVLATILPVLVAAGATQDAARIQATLAPLDGLLRGSMPVGDHASYRAAVDRLQVRPPTPGRPGAPPATMEEALHVAEAAMWRILATSPPTPGSHRPPGPQPVERLTPREREVLGMLVEGTGNRELAQVLGISSKTVMHHTVAIYRKLGVRGRTEAAAWAIRAGVGDAPQDSLRPPASTIS